VKILRFEALDPGLRRGDEEGDGKYPVVNGPVTPISESKLGKKSCVIPAKAGNQALFPLFLPLFLVV
jgi:hypothetical protein